MVKYFFILFIFVYANAESDADIRIMALRHFEVECEKGVSEGCVDAGLVYYQGRHVKKDYGKASEYFLKACKAKNGAACYNLATLIYSRKIQKIICTENFMNSNSINQEGIYGQAIYFYEKACMYKNTEGCKAAAVMHGAGIVLKQNYKKAEKYFRLGCMQGDKESCFYLGNIYSEVKEYKKSFKSYKVLCKDNYADACYNLANQYYYGRGIRQDYQKAIDLYKKAEKLGQPKGIFTVGSMYYNGLGVDRNTTEAIKLFKKCCDNNISMGCNMLEKIQNTKNKGKLLR